jgi:predicted TPR repeat methyltransferase
MDERLKKFIDANFSSPGKALDLGCGEGKDLRALRDAGWEVEGVDMPEVDLNYFYKSEKTPFDLIYSNFVIQFIQNKENFIKTCHYNLSDKGWLVIQTMDEADETMPADKKMKKRELKDLLKEKFKKIDIKKHSVFDKDPGHNHWHVVLLCQAGGKI